MIARLTRHAAVATAAALAALTLSACGAEDNTSPAADAEIEVTTPTADPDKEFEVNDADQVTTDEIQGQKVADPGMDVAFAWQGTNVATNGGTIVIVAVTNNSEVPMPPRPSASRRCPTPPTGTTSRRPGRWTRRNRASTRSASTCRWARARRRT